MGCSSFACSSFSPSLISATKVIEVGLRSEEAGGSSLPSVSESARVSSDVDTEVCSGIFSIFFSKLSNGSGFSSLFSSSLSDGGSEFEIVDSGSSVGGIVTEVVDSGDEHGSALEG